MKITSILFSLSVSLIILTSLSQFIYLIIEKYNLAQEGFEQQQSVLLAKYYINHDLQNSGFNGCTESDNNIAILPNDDIRHTDILVLAQVAENLGFLKADHKLSLPSSIHDDDIMRISDCYNSETFTLPNIKFQHNYATNALVFRSATIKYYLRESVIPRAKMRNHYALYRADQQRNATALIEGLIGFSIQRSEDNLYFKLKFYNSKTAEFVLHKGI